MTAGRARAVRPRLEETRQTGAHDPAPHLGHTLQMPPLDSRHQFVRIRLSFHRHDQTDANVKANTAVTAHPPFAKQKRWDESSPSVEEERSRYHLLWGLVRHGEDGTRVPGSRGDGARLSRRNQLDKLGDLTQGYGLTKLLKHDGIGEILLGLEPREY